MRYVFIVNPAAGKKGAAEAFFPRIGDFWNSRGIDFTCYITEGPKHAAQLARMEGGKGDRVRIYGLGGDGTLSEIASGAAGMENVEIGIFPCGSGNDFIKTFGEREDFLSPEKQLTALPRTVDTIRSGEDVSVNLCTVGMDAKVPLEVQKLKRKPFLSGSAAYDLALLKILLGKIGDEMQITIDGVKSFNGCFLMAVVGNGRYYGGGYCGAPQAVPDDGLLDFILIRKPAFYRIPTLLKLYKAGRHLQSKEFDGLLTFCRGKKIEISGPRPLVENLDGESREIGRAAFEIVPASAHFLVPQQG